MFTYSLVAHDSPLILKLIQNNKTELKYSNESQHLFNIKTSIFTNHLYCDSKQFDNHAFMLNFFKNDFLNIFFERGL